jgi:hypothetical protein
MLDDPTIERLKEFLRGKKEIAAAYLFGSQAKGHDRRGSDVDLAVVATREIGGTERLELETTLSNVVGRDVDLVVFGQAPAFLQHQILKYGRRLYEADTAERVRQEVFARSEYFDTRHLHRALRA